MKIRINNVEQISKILDVIHDQWFDLNELKFKKEEGVVEIPFQRELEKKSKLQKHFLFFKKRLTPITLHVLRIYNAQNYSVVDSEKVGKYDFNEIFYNLSQKKVIVKCGVPLVITIEVDLFDIEVEAYEVPIKMKTSFTI